ncbi:translation initiation factor IF-2 [Desulfurobacterium thermolithotrophum DSM 11699]|uniref:Translation initiation factor IF-2 n=1 Tax=Desulfurobacterium thermolithotrophum (strain DSM 11699 / BSA) TaxID=868864 RepID=F0S3B8_DESTD|nr:translation initiation factor IF-2 [Desulfurobacterium thermolithotrophum]ADY73340.1 translation initiation factor IF-2 [Desulfurobacterium thermolithotrophum DSM 11699]
MAKVRIHQLAKELGMSSKELIKKLREELDIQVKSIHSGLDEKQVMLVKEFIKPVQVEVSKATIEDKSKEKELPKEKVEDKTEIKKEEVIISKDQDIKQKEEESISEKKEEQPQKVEKAEKKKEEKREERREEKREEKRKKKSDVRILSPEELARRRRRRRKPFRRHEEERKVEESRESKPPRRREKPQRLKREEKQKPIEEKVTREQLEKLVASTKEGREREKPKTVEDMLAEKKREQKELEDQKKFEELMRKIEEKNRAKKKKRKKKKKEEVKEEIPFEELSEEEQLQRLIEEEERAKTVIIPEVISAREFAEKLGIDPTQLLQDLITLGKFITINQPIDFETAAKVAEKYGKVVKLEGEEEEESLLEKELEETPDKEEDLKPRPPIITVMGHVDHGKTTLLDYIRNTKVAEREAGGITQHIGASVVEVDTSEGKKKLVFLDTPGHEAFTAMRARGAQVTDIAVLVVAADDGVMPQTVEAINHAKAAGVPIIVAINKIDKPGANPDRVKQELTQHGLIAEDWGGDTVMVPVSAKTGEGVDELLEMIALQAELMELKANPDKPARGVVLEAKLDRQRGPVATLLIQSGTLKQGDAIVAGLYAGKIRAMFDDKGKSIKEAGPSMPVEVLGLDGVPLAGDKFYVVKDEKTARKIAEKRQELARESALEKEKKVSLEDLFAQVQQGEVKELNIVLKADAQGSIEAIRKSLEELSTDEVKVKIIHTGVGPITENDIMLAAASNAIVVGFNVRPDSAARKAAEKEKIDVRTYRVIYDIVDEVKKAMQGLLTPEEKEVYLGSAEVRATFKVPKVGTVAGCYVKDGVIKRNAGVRLVRDGIVIYEGKIASLKRFKDDVREVQAGYECGIGLENFNDIKVGDIIECYTTEQVEKEL